MSAAPGGNLFLLGVSIPRSGHHFLATLLERVLGGDLRYCEYYSQEDCCRQVPCSRPRAHRVTYQKNHDLDLAVDPHLPDVSYVIQYREPVPAVVSDRELFAAVRGSRLADDQAQYVAFLAEKGAHYTKFYDKWIRRPRPDVLVVKYEHLLAEPAAVMRDLFRFCAIPVAPDRLAHAVGDVAPVLNRTPILKETAAAPFSPRVVARSKYFDPELLAVYESLVLDLVPELAAHRVFPALDYRNHPLFALFNLHCALLDRRRDDLAGLAEDAQRAFPDHLYVNVVAGEALRQVGQHAAALPGLERAVLLAPHDAEVIVSCANVNIALGNVSRACDLAAQLVTLVPDDSSHRLFLATILMMAGRPAEALHQAVSALDLGIVEPHLWRAFGSLVHEARRAGVALRVAGPGDAA